MVGLRAMLWWCSALFPVIYSHPCDKHTDQCCHHACKMFVGPCCHHDTSTREICCCGGCGIDKMGSCAADYQAPVPTPTPALPQGAATPDPTCSRGTLIQINATSSLCCAGPPALAPSRSPASVDNSLLTNTTLTCQRPGQAVAINVTEANGATISSGAVVSSAPGQPPPAGQGACRATCCSEARCEAYTWWADTPAAAPSGCHHGNPCCVLYSGSAAQLVRGGAPACPDDPGSHFACAVSGVLGSAAPMPTPAPAPAPTPADCNAEQLAAAGKTCDKVAAPCLVTPLPSTAEICCYWQDWAKCDAATTSTPCPTVACVANVSCPAGPASWCSSEWGNVHARGWCTGCCERFSAQASRSVIVAAAAQQQQQQQPGEG